MADSCSEISETEGNRENACDTYFHILSTPNKKIIPVCVADNSIFDVDIDKYGNIDLLTRKSRKFQNNEKYKIFGPSLPLDVPNKYKAIPPKEISIDHDRGPWVHRLFEGYKQYDRLKRKEYKQFHESLVTFDDILVRRFLHRSINCFRRNNFRVNPHEISDFIADIPKPLGVQLLDESIGQEIENFDNNFNLRNCLCSYSKFGRIFIFCPTGELMDRVLMKELLIDDDLIHDPIKFKMLKSVEHFTICTEFLVKEITCTDETLHVRGDYWCYIYQIELTLTSSELVLIRKYNFDKIVHSIGINLDSPKEMFVVTENQKVFHLLDMPQPNKVVSDVDPKSRKWQTCIYGNSRETCLISNEDEVLLYDFRMKSTVPCTYINLSTCDYVNEKLKLSPVLSWNPMHQHQYFVSTNQNIMINDERYLKTPVLQFNHYLKSPPVFMDMLQNLSVTQPKALLVVGSYKTADSVLYEMSSNGVKEVSMGTSENLKCRNPVTVTQPLYKLSDYSDWKGYHLDWRFSLSNYAERLSLPCIGINLSPLESVSDTNNKYFSVVKQSLAGDLFFQQILSTVHDIDEKLNKTMSENTTAFQTVSLTEETQSNGATLIEPCRKRCQQWMDAFVEKTKIGGNDGDNGVDGTSSRKDSWKEDCYGDIDRFATYVRDEFKYNDLKGARRVDLGSTCYGLESYILYNTCASQDGLQQGDVNCFCVECSVSWSNKLAGLRNKNNILTRNSLGFPKINDLPSTCLEKVKDLNFSEKPFCKALQTQWNEEVYTPINVFSPNIDAEFDVEQYL